MSSPHNVSRRAVYAPQAVRDYRNNPWIEALPPILSPSEAQEALLVFPEYHEEDRSLPDHIRLHEVGSISRLFLPFTRHVHLEQDLGALIRRGYIGRWSDDIAQKPGAIGEVSSRVEAFRRSEAFKCTAQSASLIGIPGAGKSVALSSILALYPQVIDHDYYRDIPIANKQLVHITIESSRDGSLRAVCLQFLAKVDALLETPYMDLYGSPRATVDNLMLNVARVAALHRLGLLVIEEIQHLRSTSRTRTRESSAERNDLMKFLTNLTNSLSLPVLYVGTYAARGVLTAEFRQTRRSMGAESQIWHAMQNDAEWKVLTETLWRYQYCDHPIEHTDEISSVLHYETGGIPDLVVKLCQRLQKNSIRRKLGKLTSPLIQRFARETFALAQPALEALRTHRWNGNDGFEDLIPFDLKALTAEEPEASIEIITEPSTPEPVARPAAPLAPEKRVVIKSQSGLLVVHKEAKSNKTSPYEILVAMNVIRSIDEFFPSAA